MYTALLLVGTLLAQAFAAPSSRHVLHEKRDILPHAWARTAKLDSRSTIPMSIALSQSNLEKLDEYLNEVSHPKSPKFGQHWDAKKIAETFAPSQDSHDDVREWLASEGITADRISLTQSLGWLRFEATVEEAERLLKTKYHLYEHESGVAQVGCESYHVPEHISKHVGKSIFPYF